MTEEKYYTKAFAKLKKQEEKIKAKEEKRKAKEKYKKEKARVLDIHEKYTATKRFKNFFMRRMKKGTIIGVNMERLNGTYESFLVNIDDGGFIYSNNQYVIDNELKYYNTSAKMWFLDYHERFSLPINRKVPVSMIKKSLSNSGIESIEMSANPEILQKFVSSKIAQQVLDSGELDKSIKMLKIIGFITLLMVIIHLLLFVQKTGMLDSVTGSLGL